MKKFLLSLIIVLLTIGISLPVQADSGASDTDSINEKLGSPIVVYGAQLSTDQRTKVRELLNVQDGDMVEEHDVSGQDAATYINGNPNSNMYSSAKITRQEAGNGLTINIVTPENITEVTKEMYANALLTAGVENATVDVASPVKVSGHSALTGIYKAYDVEGEQLDKERMELANEELDVATQLAEKEGMSQEKVSQLLTDIKKTIAEQNPATKEEVEQIVQEQLDQLEISLSEADRQMLIDLIDKMRDLNINFDQVKNQLEDIASTIKDKADELGLDEGFWEKVANFFSDMFQALSNFFKGLFN
ncbi:MULTISPECIES: DUF1002 domain-containing protein [Virgibacillus]|uniref:DUF1002 domain-containing protein n=1 Tax=Virgibacillus kapii TaxID=1638645 RepID=A0ABQ2DD15_9BACI|nr:MULTISPECIES: DUF1002 domain-containing protein [Virgibacillus]EQB38292.1 hypothetical protein M948_06850 [Virgibacillus sp. CM-4]MYL40991.1 DUF1002 domain-containing protein [Virgibacillus massiliensis]GGJ53433.1 hypothetical protein GCM10007111_14570 [Virgibacillus kapii]